MTAGRTFRRLAIIGDLAGRFDVFDRVLKECGVEEDNVPIDLAVVQVGDVVTALEENRDGNSACLARSDALLRANPDNYFQFFGNHDLARMEGGAYRRGWRGDLSQDPTITSWWAERHGLLAAAIRAAGSDRWTVISHAGVTAGYWRLLDEAPAPELARRINDFVGQPLTQFLRPGSILDGVLNETADPTWAEVNFEFYLPWLSEGVAPFDQIHGHASPWSWKNDAWWSKTPDRIRAITQVDGRVRRTSTVTGEFNALSVDWALDSATTDAGWRIVELDQAPIEIII